MLASRQKSNRGSMDEWTSSSTWIRFSPAGAPYEGGNTVLNHESWREDRVTVYGRANLA